MEATIKAGLWRKVNIPNPNIAEHLLILEDYASKCERGLIEIGCDVGWGSTLAFRRGIERATRPCEDIYPFWVSVDIKNQLDHWLTPALRSWSFVCGDSRSKETVKQVAELVLVQNFPDLIFIDTIHEYGFIQQELAAWRFMACETTTWLFHDTWMNGVYNHMTDAIKEFAEQSGLWEYSDLSTTSNGLGALLPRKRT